KGTWLWDNAFHSKIWSLCNLDFARYILHSHMKFQVLDDPEDWRNYGRIPHSIEISRINGWTQPPLMAWAYWELFKKNGSIVMLQHVFSRLFSYHLWLNYNRDLNKDGLYSWVHGFESGLDNAPRYDDVSPLECDAVDFSALVSLQLQCLIDMAEILKDDSTKESLVKREQELDEWLNEDLWDDDVGFYFDKAFAGDFKGEFIGPKMISGFYPLFAGVVPKDRIGLLLEHLTRQTEFWTAFPVPSVARDEPSFSVGMNMWRGPTWINTNYMIIKGLKKYGFRRLPGELAYKTVVNVFEVYERFENFYEYYGSIGNNAEIESFERKNEKNGPRPYFMGWTGLVANILLEDILGIEAQYDAILLNPSMPDKLISDLGGDEIRGRIPHVEGWDQKEINFKLFASSKGIIEYHLQFEKLMDLYIVDATTREKIFSGKVDTVSFEVKNNRDTFAILSKPDGEVIQDKKEQRE
ncbi:MAG: amylo-alpha-1,6-glucosidase, partial [Promethearchaeota archaeon]